MNYIVYYIELGYDEIEDLPGKAEGLA